MGLSFEEVLKRAEANRAEMFRFLRELVAIPSESCQEEKVVLRVKKEMEKVGFDRVEIDPMGNILGFIGQGGHLVALDAHMDTVAVGDPDLWEFDPYAGFEDEEVIGGRGSSDQKGGLASMVYAGKLIKDLGIKDDFTLVMTGTVQEEDCDGLSWQYIIEEDRIRPQFVVSTEPTSCGIARGQRGRMEIRLSTKGISCHGSAQEQGENAVLRMTPILQELEDLNSRLQDDPFLGRGTLTVSEIFSRSPSRSAVPDGCTLSIDRRLTAGESREFALEQIRSLQSVKEAKAEVSLYDYARPSYTGLVYPAKAWFPSWTVAEEHPVCRTLVDAYKHLFQQDPVVDRWTFSSSGVSIAGRYNIPCLGFGPGHEDQAHAPNEKTWKKELIRAAAMYSVMPLVFVKCYAKDMQVPGQSRE
ncbi:MAG: YgeY family selenium metabolism-linked hydrolase [Desulfohalobiaceae bacterium]|nr:YgeY family selenium metabolism-linked hydrolase [Desulfohalobiaceae bacterium]